MSCQAVRGNLPRNELFQTITRAAKLMGVADLSTVISTMWAAISAGSWKMFRLKRSEVWINLEKRLMRSQSAPPNETNNYYKHTLRPALDDTHQQGSPSDMPAPLTRFQHAMGLGRQLKLEDGHCTWKVSHWRVAVAWLVGI